MDTEDTKKKKLESRKFIAYLIWVVIAGIVMIGCTSVMLYTRQIIQSMVDLIKTVLDYLFYLTMVYIGFNAGQKVGLAIADKLPKSEDKEEQESYAREDQ